MEEIAEEALLGADYERRVVQSRLQAAGALGDALYSMLVLAETCGMDAAGALDTA